MIIMKRIFLLISINLIVSTTSNAQETETSNSKNQEFVSLIGQYLEARENRDTVLLRSILASNIDQLVSSGEWRIGIKSCVHGMMRSSTNNPGKRKIEIEKFRLLNPDVGIVDARYEITNSDGSIRKMWSTFIVVLAADEWKIAAIRNMRYL